MEIAANTLFLTPNICIFIDINCLTQTLWKNTLMKSLK